MKEQYKKKQNLKGKNKTALNGEDNYFNFNENEDEDNL